MHIPKHGVRGGLGYGVDWGTGWIGVRGGLGYGVDWGMLEGIIHPK